MTRKYRFALIWASVGAALSLVLFHPPASQVLTLDRAADRAFAFLMWALIAGITGFIYAHFTRSSNSSPSVSPLAGTLVIAGCVIGVGLIVMVVMAAVRTLSSAQESTATVAQSTTRSQPSNVTSADHMTSSLVLRPGWWGSENPSKTKEKEWSAASTSFIAEHPDLRLGSNIYILQGNIYGVYRRNPYLKASLILRMAYQDSQRYSEWMRYQTSPLARSPYVTGDANHITQNMQSSTASPATGRRIATVKTPQDEYPNTPHNKHCWKYYYSKIDNLSNNLPLGEYVNTRDRYLKEMHECLRH